MIVAIDGPAGAGKGTIASYLGLKFDLVHLDTGLLYRALARVVIAERIDCADASSVVNIARTMTVKDIEAGDLRGEQVAAIASQVAVIGEVREILNDIQRKFCKEIKEPYQGAILDGRDIGTVICPDADCKLFVTARPEIRNQRRLLETPGNADENIRNVARNIEERDNRDATRKIAPLTPARDAYIVDTSDLSINEACLAAANFVKEAFIKIQDRTL
jgi:cytidylate kinase